jgi:hypothetical protein
MESLIDALGLGQEVLDLAKDGMSGRGITKILRQRHADFQIIPSPQTINKYIREHPDGVKPTGVGITTRLTGNLHNDVMILQEHFDSLFHKMCQIYGIKVRGATAIEREQFKQLIAELEWFYTSKTNDAKVQDWQAEFIREFDLKVITPFLHEQPYIHKEAEEKWKKLFDKFVETN